MGFLSRVRSHAQQHVVGYIALAIVVSGGTAYAANEWTGENIVDESLTGDDIEHYARTGVVRVPMPATRGTNVEVLTTTDGFRFVGRCMNRDANGRFRRFAELSIDLSGVPQLGFPFQATYKDVDPPTGPTVRGPFRFHDLTADHAIDADITAALNLDGSNDCFFVVIA
jgi:hypothetical protein